MLIKGLLLLRVLQLKIKAEWIICTLIKGGHGNFLLKNLKEGTLLQSEWLCSQYVV